MAQALTGHVAAFRTGSETCPSVLRTPGLLQGVLQRTPYALPWHRQRGFGSAEEYGSCSGGWSSSVWMWMRGHSRGRHASCTEVAIRKQQPSLQSLVNAPDLRTGCSTVRRKKSLSQAGSGEQNGVLHLQQDQTLEGDATTSSHEQTWDEERVQSGQAASTSGVSENGIAADRGAAPDAPQNETARRGRAPRKPSKAATLKKGKEVFSQLLGSQSAWLSAPLLALAEKKNKQGGKQKARTKEKETSKSEVENPGARKEESGKSTVRRRRGATTDTSAEPSSSLHGDDRIQSEVAVGVESGGTQTGEVELLANDTVPESTGHRVRAGKAESGVAEQAGLSKDEFIRRLEELQKGLGVAAQSLAREGRAVKLQEESGLLLSAEELGIDSELLEDRTEKPHWSAVGAGGLSKPSKRPPQNRSNRLRAWSPVKRDANAAVAQIMAFRVRTSTKRVEAPFRPECDSDSEAEEEAEEVALLEALKQETNGGGELELAQNRAEGGAGQPEVGQTGAANGTLGLSEGPAVLEATEGYRDMKRSESKNLSTPSTEDSSMPMAEGRESNGWYSGCAEIAGKEDNGTDAEDVQPREQLSAAQSRNGALLRPDEDSLQAQLPGRAQGKGLVASVVVEDSASFGESQMNNKRRPELRASSTSREGNGNLSTETASRIGAASETEAGSGLTLETRFDLHEYVDSRLAAGKEGPESGRVEENPPAKRLSNGATSFFSRGKKQQDLVKRVAQRRPPEEVRTLEELGRKSQEQEGLVESQTLVSASRRIGKDARALPATGPLVESLNSAKPAYGGRRPAKNYTSEEDEQLFEKLGFRLTGSELGRIEEWLSSREVPELKLPRPRDRTGRYFIMPIVKAVEEHLRALGRLDSGEPEAGSLLTPAGAPQAVSGENADQFFQEMTEELSADVVLQTRELLASQDSEEAPRKQRKSVSDLLDCFSDDSDTEHDVESLFHKVGLSANGGKKRALGNFERAEIARFLMGLNRQGLNPPSKQDWPRSPSGERYSKDTLREVWRQADDMGGLQVYLKWCQEEEDVERLLVETLSKNRLLKGEDWRECSAEESLEVDSMDPPEKLKAVEFLVQILEGGKRLDWKKHRDIWPRKNRSAYLLKSTTLLALVKVARKHGGLRSYLDLCRKELMKPLSIAQYTSNSNDWQKAARAPNHFPPLGKPNGFSVSERGSDSEGVSISAPSRGVNGTETLLQLKGAVAENKGWRGRSFSKGEVSQMNAQGGSIGTRLPDGAGLSPDVLPSRPDHFSRDPPPAGDLPSDRRLIPRGFSIPQPKETRDKGFAFWRTGNNETRSSSSFLPSRSTLSADGKGMIRSAVTTSKPHFSTSGGGSFSQQKDLPAESKWPSFSEAKPPPVAQPKISSSPPTKEEPFKRPSAEKRASLREVSPIERRRRRRLLGIKVQRHEDGDMLGENEVFEVTVGRPRRTMREILRGYAQEKVLVRAEELAQPLLVEETPRSVEDGLLETLVSGHKSEMEEFKDTSRQYMRAWQDFQTWSDFFQYKNKKRPTITDVEATGIPWLIEKAKAYVLLRKHMIQLAEGNEKLLSAMATIQAELNRRTTASVATDRGSTAARYTLESKPVQKRGKGRPRTKKQFNDPVGTLIIEELGLGKDDLE